MIWKFKHQKGSSYKLVYKHLRKSSYQLKKNTTPTTKYTGPH